MKTILTIQAQPNPRKLSVKKSQVEVINFLTSLKFFIFVAVTATVLCWWGCIIGDDKTLAGGGILFLAGFIPRAWRETRRDIRHPERIL